MLAISGHTVSSRRDSSRHAKETWPYDTCLRRANRGSYNSHIPPELPQCKSSMNTSNDERTEMSRETRALSMTSFFSVCHAYNQMKRLDSDEDSSSDYVPSDEESENDDDDEEEEEEEEEEETELRMGKRVERDRDQDEDVAGSDDEEQGEEVTLYDNVKVRKHIEDQRRWAEPNDRHTPGGFRSRRGCITDTTLAHLETRRRARQEKTRHHVYKVVLLGFAIVYLIQLALVYFASSRTFSMVTWRDSSTEKIFDWKHGLACPAQTKSNGNSDISARLPVESSLLPIPDYVRTGLHLCATLSQRVIKLDHDALVTQHALRACDIAVNYAPKRSREAIEAHVLRGDLLSLISRFDSAEEDYRAAMTVLEAKSSDTTSQVALELLQDVSLKTLANHWTQLYKKRRFKALKREAKVHAVHPEHQTGEDDPACAVSELAAGWLSAFKQKKSVLEVLTLQRSYTLRRLRYKALNGDCTN